MWPLEYWDDRHMWPCPAFIEFCYLAREGNPDFMCPDSDPKQKLVDSGPTWSHAKGTSWLVEEVTEVLLRISNQGQAWGCFWLYRSGGHLPSSSGDTWVKLGTFHNKLSLTRRSLSHWLSSKTQQWQKILSKMVMWFVDLDAKAGEMLTNGI